MGKKSQQRMTGLEKKQRIAESIARKKAEEDRRRKEAIKRSRQLLKALAGIDLEEETEE